MQSATTLGGCLIAVLSVPKSKGMHDFLVLSGKLLLGSLSRVALKYVTSLNDGLLMITRMKKRFLNESFESAELK